VGADVYMYTGVAVCTTGAAMVGATVGVMVEAMVVVIGVTVSLTGGGAIVCNNGAVSSAAASGGAAGSGAILLVLLRGLFFFLPFIIMQMAVTNAATQHVRRLSTQIRTVPLPPPELLLLEPREPEELDPPLFEELLLFVVLAFAAFALGCTFNFPNGRLGGAVVIGTGVVVVSAAF